MATFQGVSGAVETVAAGVFPPAPQPPAARTPDAARPSAAAAATAGEGKPARSFLRRVRPPRRVLDEQMVMRPSLPDRRRRGRTLVEPAPPPETS